MPFNTTNVVPPTNPTVTVKFAGLLLLKAGAGNTCEVGVHRFSPFHTFQVMLVVNKPNKPLTFIRLLTGPLTAPMSISVLPAPAAAFMAFARDPFDRANAAVSHEFDYRWALNVRSLQLDSAATLPLHPNADVADGARPVLTLNAGVLYTSNLTPPALKPVLTPVTPSPAGPQPLHSVAADLAIAIDVPTGSAMLVAWHELGEPQTLTLPRELDPAGTTYTISIMNDPPISTPIFHDELELYYKVLQVGGLPIPRPQQFRLQITTPGKTDEIPCLPVIMDP